MSGENRLIELFIKQCDALMADIGEPAPRVRPGDEERRLFFLFARQMQVAGFDPEGLIEMSQSDASGQGDTFNVAGDAAVVAGRGSHVHDVDFTKLWSGAESQIDLELLARDLSILREELKKEPLSPEQDVSVGAVAAAEMAAQNGDGATALENLAKAGTWVLEVAQKVGVAVAVAASKAALGL